MAAQNHIAKQDETYSNSSSNNEQKKKNVATLSLSNINVIAELEHNAIEFSFASEEELKVICPFHKDTNPSCFININKKVFSCHTSGCERTGDIISFIAAKVNKSRAQVIIELSQRYSLEEDANIVDVFTVEKYFNELPKALPFLAELYKRGITDEDIQYYRIGFNKNTKRIAIPILNEEGLYVNVRMYLPGAPGPEKFRNLKGHGSARLFPINQLKYERIMYCGGELKAIVAARELNKYEIGAICSTAGEENLESKNKKGRSLLHHFKNKIIYICLDIDDAGKNAAINRAKQFWRIAKEIYIIDLSLDIKKYPKGDINDYVAQEGGKLYPLIESLTDENQWKFTVNKNNLDNSEEPSELSLIDCIKAESTGTRIRTTATVSSLDTAPYIIPKDVVACCDRAQKVCALCDIFLNKDNQVYNINPESPSVLEMIGSRKHLQREAIMDSLNIPKLCKVVEFEPKTFYNYEDVRISPQLEITSRSADRLIQPARILTGVRDAETNKIEELELNESYSFTGRNWPSPDKQQSVLLLSEYKQTTDALSNFILSDNYKKQLAIFQPKKWTEESIKEKLKEIYQDLSANVTYIFQRESLHLTVDLAYHSPLFISFDGRTVKGWTDILIIGDTAQGKSDTPDHLRNHYKLGESVECKNATVAGLLGGLQKYNDRWFASWGIIPTHDKRLVVLQELKGANIEVIGKLTDMRSSGIAEIPKIEKRRTHARTRLLSISNTRSGREVTSYNFGIESIRELVGNLEDVRRYDFALILSQKDIDHNQLNQLRVSRPEVPHIYTGELCRNLILWGWTVEKAYFEPEAEKLCLQYATELSNLFTDYIPLIDKGSARFKLARLSAALAVRTFSHGADYNCLVRCAHVEYIFNFIKKLYSTDVFGYSSFTDALKTQDELKDADQIKHELSLLPYPRDFCEQILYKHYVSIQDIQDILNWDRERANNLLSLLVRKRAVNSIKGGYYKSPKFIELLKYALNNGVLKDRPKHIPEPNVQDVKEKF